MMTESEYFNAWIYYLAGALLLSACWWYLAGKIPWREGRQLSRVLVIAALLVPWYTNTQQEYLSPAILIAIVEGLFEGDDAFWRAGTPLLVGITVALGLSLVYSLARWFIVRQLHARREAA